VGVWFGDELDPISKKEWGFILLRLMNIGRGVKGRKNRDNNGKSGNTPGQGRQVSEGLGRDYSFL
jgi:hypothetical protein